MRDTERSSAVALIDEGNALEEQGLIPEAMARYEAAVQADSRCARAHLNRGNILADTLIDKARSAYQLAITCDPHYADAHFNLGNLNYRAGEFELALRNYQAAVEIRSDFADAFVAMGNALEGLGRISEAVESYKRALAISPSYAEIHLNLGVLATTQGRHVEAAYSMLRALELKPASTTKAAFASCVARARFTTDDSRIRTALTTAIIEPWAMPLELCWPALSLIMLDERIASCVRRANESWPARLPKAALFGADGLAALAADPLLHAVLEATPVSTIEFERFLTCARNALLETASSNQAPDPSDLAALQFFASLSRQCFVNEYIFECDDRELIAAGACRTKLLALLDANAVVPPFLLLAVAAYFPLNTLHDPSRLLAANEPGAIDEVLRQQIREPLEERALRAGVECLTSITSGVSEQVRDQYEQNPYPRWVKLPIPEQPLRFNDELRRTLPFGPFTPMPDDSAPEVLIAGCGTGSQSILAAQRFRGARVLAIDLSLSSISYAKRKTQELGITNIEYAQADILKLGDIARTFDVIESCGVLHHLADPFDGWRTLLSRLRPGGFMSLGFYSETARRHVVKAREFIATRGYASTPDNIRRFRQDLAVVELQLLSKLSDFYSTSNCRDLLFHVQEHRLTIDQVESFLAEFGLHFIGFQLDRRELHQYRARFPDDPSGTNLRNWARFEADNPDTFIGMYQFWIQKRDIGQRMPDINRSRIDQATAEDGVPVTSRKPAVALLDEGNALEEQGRIPEAMARYDAAVQADPQCARAHLNRGNILAGAKFDEARTAYELAIRCDPHYAGAYFNLGNLYYRAGGFELALRNYQAAVGIRPDFTDALVAMGNTLDSLGHTAKAVESYERAIAINPGCAEIHFNLGVLAATQGRHEEAANSLRRAVEIKPDFTQAHYKLGMVLSRLEQLDAAEASLSRALSLDPESVEILRDLTNIFLSRGKCVEALSPIVRILERVRTWSIKSAFASCAARTRFTTTNPQIRVALTTAISEPWGLPHELCPPALSLIMLDQRIARCVRMANGSWPVRLPKAALFGFDGLGALAEDLLLHALLEAAPVNSIEFERFLTCARHALLETASTKGAADQSDVAALRFYAALTRQCFVNEYIFDCDDTELISARACRTGLLELLDAHAVVPPLLVLAVAAYFPLNALRGASRLLAANQRGPVDEVLRQQIREPLEEQALRPGIECLTAITDGISERVRDQYEQNPYPRWVKTPMGDHPLHFNDELRRTLPFAAFTPMPDDSAPEVLVAGCGTGIHSIFTSQRFRGARVLAIDLALSSISYAKRKTLELGVTNIEYAQADILNLGDISRTFDIIESGGVLHHLADPFMGWRILLSRLRPGGFMGLGFYSELARRHVVKARELISAHGYASTPDDIRRFRQNLTVKNMSAEMQWLSRMPDFYTTSACRDLLFHVQEHRLTLGQIDSFLAEFGLHFIGFDLDPPVLDEYRTRFTDDPSCTNLHNWARFEADNPDTFIGMYRFWVQQPANSLVRSST